MITPKSLAIVGSLSIGAGAGTLLATIPIWVPLLPVSGGVALLAIARAMRPRPRPTMAPPPQLARPVRRRRGGTLPPLPPSRPR